MADILRANRAQVLAFRLEGHGLHRRQPSAALLEAASLCGLRNTPPGSAALAVCARIAALSPHAIDDMLTNDKTLVEVIGMRISPWIVPTRDAALFTHGALPTHEKSLLATLNAIAPALQQHNMPASTALQLAMEAAYAELDGQILPKGVLSGGMTRRLPEILCPWCKACATHHVSESLFRLVGVSGVFCVAPRTGKGSSYVRTDQWLGPSLPTSTPATLRSELLQRYLSCFGPSTSAHFATWTGIAPVEAQQAWELISAQLIEVACEGQRAWLHSADLARFEHPTPASGVRLLPPYDAYLDQQDRATLLPDKTWQRRVWTTLGNPGVVLADGEIVALWRPQKKGKRLLVTIESFTPLSPPTRTLIEDDAALLAPYKGCTSAEVIYAD